MILILFLISLSISLVSPVTIEWENLEKIVEFSKEIQNADEKSELEVARAVTNLLSIMPYVGPLASLVSSIMGIFAPNDQDSYLRQMGQRLQDHLNRIEDELGNIERLITDTAIQSDYKHHQEKVKILAEMYKRMISGGTKSQKDDFISECKNNNMLKFIVYLDGEITSGQTLSMRHMMLNQVDYKLFLKWFKSIAGVFSQAMTLHFICLGTTITQSENSDEFTKTVSFDRQEFNEKANNLQRFFKSGITTIKDQSIDQAVSEVHSFINGHSDWSHETFADNVYRFLSEKYYWRYWLVGSYNGGASGYDQHCVGGNRFHFHDFRDNGRSVFVGSTNNNQMDIEAELKKCLSRHNYDEWYNGHTPENIWRSMSACLPDYNGLAVIRFGNGLSGYHTSRATSFYNINPSWAGYSILVIAPELA